MAGSGIAGHLDPGAGPLVALQKVARDTIGVVGVLGLAAGIAVGVSAKRLGWALEIAVTNSPWSAGLGDVVSGGSVTLELADGLPINNNVPRAHCLIGLAGSGRYACGSNGGEDKSRDADHGE